MTTNKTPFDRLTASDMFLLLWDDYGWRSDIGGLAVLDGTSLLDADGQVQVDEVRRQLQARLHLVPRFRQLLHRPRFGLGWPLWVDAPAFDIADHVRVHRLPVPAGESELLAACAELAQRRMDLTRPLWELWLLPGLPDGRIGAYLKLHHALADGGAALATFAALLDLTPDTPTPVPPEWTPTPLPSAGALALDNLRRRGRELRHGTGGLVHLRRTLRQVRHVLPAWREVLTEEHAPRTSLNTPVTDQRQLAVVRSRLDDVKDVGHTHAATVNDVVLAAVSGGLRDLLISRGEPVQGLALRAMVTISLHDEEPGHAQGNKPGWMMVPLPLDEPDPARRLERIAAQTAARKHKPRPEAGTGIFRFLAGQRLWYREFPRQRAVNIVVTNVPGPPMPVYLAGARVREVFPVMCVMGNLTLVVAALSYEGQLNLTAIADGQGCPDLEVFTHGVSHALDRLSDPVRSAAAR
jgi:diacylglycerol O-acyltransferase / wax synthase